MNVGKKLMIFALIDGFDAYSISTSVKTKDTVSFVGAATVHNSGSCNACIQNRASHYCVSLNNHKGICEKRSYDTYAGNSLIFQRHAPFHDAAIIGSIVL
jgi:hypothetical protein